MKNLLKGCTAVATATTLLLGSTMSIFAFPDDGYNEITSEQKTFSTDDEAFAYCQSRAEEIAYSMHTTVEYQTTYVSDGEYMSHFYVYGYNDGNQAASQTTTESEQTTSSDTSSHGNAIVTEDELEFTAGTTYLPEEDRYFSSNDEAYQWALNNGYDVAVKHGGTVRFYVAYCDNGEFVLHFYLV